MLLVLAFVPFPPPSPMVRAGVKFTVSVLFTPPHRVPAQLHSCCSDDWHDLKLLRDSRFDGSR